MAKPNMTPRAVLAGLRVPETDSQRRAIFAVLESELAESVSELAADTAASNDILRSRACFIAALKHVSDLLTHNYEAAAKMEVSPKAPRSRRSIS